MIQSENVFTKVNDTEEKLKALEYIIEQKSEVLAKPKQANESVYRLLPIKIENNILICKFETKLNIKSLKHVIIKFVTENEQFVAQCDCEVAAENLHIDISNDFYKLFRRNDFRIKLPFSFKASLHVIERNKKTINKILPVLDLSAGGCRVEIQSSIDGFSSGDAIEAKLLIEHRDPIRLSAVLKHVAPLSDLNDKQMGGVQFSKFDDLSKDKLVSLMLDIYRELFAAR